VEAPQRQGKLDYITLIMYSLDQVASIVSFHHADIAGLQEALSNQVDVSCASVAKDPEA
jgi:hypothetical protein